jgi:tRNA U55 pseudouridine synthase TruB
MKPWVVIEKEAGETPLMALSKWKRENPSYLTISASYAGRLDPMASGKLLVLLGEECKQQKKYTNLDKEYEIELLFDVGSDTGDALGLVEYSGTEVHVGRDTLEAVLRSEKGSHTRPYPPFSSKTVNGKPLFLHTLEGTVDNLTIPEHEERVYRIRQRRISYVTSQTLQERIKDFFAKVPRTNAPSKRLGEDFRIDAVRSSWESVFTGAGQREFTIVSLKVVCGSGTYMRALAGRIGGAFGTRALALSIKRTKIGKFGKWWWVKKY